MRVDRGLGPKFLEFGLYLILLVCGFGRGLVWGGVV
jgi:hypothetical protein